MSFVYKKMTGKDFLEGLEQLVCDNAKTLLSVEGVYEPLAEHFNNQILERWLKNKVDEHETLEEAALSLGVSIETLETELEE